MSGYKRVNFYELCRLCASNQQKEKTHIFQEEGRKIQLQNKIQICLSLKVCENDFLPKVVCSQCLRTLEECYTFRNECVTSESMLSSYFNNFRYTDDFKKSGKVYIKDTTTAKTQQKDLTQKQLQQQNFDFISIPNANNISSSNIEDSNDPLYALSQNESSKTLKSDNNGKPLAYNLSTINFAALKGIVQNMPKNEQVNNIAVSSSGEIINITPLIDLESLLVQNQLQQKPVVKHTTPKVNKKTKCDKNDGNAEIKRQISDKYDKLPHIKSTQPGKFAYAIKIEESSKNGGGGSAVVVNQISNVNVPINNSQNNFNTNYNPVSNVNVTNNGQTNNVSANWNFPAPVTSNNMNLINNSNLIATNNQTMFNQTSNWNLITTTANVTTNNITPSTNSVVTSNIAEQTEKLIQSIQHQLPQDNKQNILNGSNRNSDIQTVDISSIKNEQPIKTFACEFCPKVFKRREHLYQHVKLHTGFRPYGCENCKKSFMRKEHLMRHLTSHTGQKNFTCNICEKSFSRNDNLLKHKKTHDKQTSFTCEICQKQFVMKHYYLAHKMGHESSEKCQFWNILKT